MMAKTFNKIAFLLISICLPFVAANASCKEDQEKEFIDCGKQYLQLDQIDLVENAIFVKIDDTIYETPCLYSDEAGYYILQIRKRSCALWEWECGYCHECNSRLEKCCDSCNRDKKGKKCK